MNIIKDIDEGTLKGMVNSLVYKDVEAEELYQRSINNTSGRGVQNGKHQTNWNRRYNSIMKIAETNGLKSYKIDRVIWEAIIVQDEKGGIYLFFRDDNLKKIINKGKDTHYAKLLIRAINKAFNGILPLSGQAEFLFTEDEVEPMNSNEYLMELAEKMLSVFEKEPEKVVIITFDTKFNYDIATAYVYNTEFEIVHKKDLTYLIESDYNPVLVNDNINTEKQESSNKSSSKRIVRLKKK